MSEAVECIIVDGLNGTPAAELAVRGWLEMVESGLSDGTLNMAGSMQAVIGYAPNGRDMLPVGVITFAVELGYVWVNQSFVVKDFRGRGVYTAMFSALHRHVVDELPAVRSIRSATSVKNKVMRQIAHKQGRREEAIILHLDIQR